MPKPTFDVIGYRARLGLTQPELGQLLHLSGPACAIAAWEAHQRSNGRKRYGPSASAIAYMELLERLWRLYHKPSRLKVLLRAVLPDKLWQTAPKRKSS